MRLPQLRCKCSELIIKSADDSSKIRSKIIIIKGGGVYAVCKQCATEVEIPLEISKSAANIPIIIKK